MASSDTLTDQDPMPFGKHKGQKMEDVPASYLHWFYHQVRQTGARPDQWPVVNYIEANKAALMQETKNLIWD